MADVSAIIVSFNTKDLVRDCINNLLETKEFSEIVLVDNGSQDGTAEMAEKEFGDKILLVKTQNNGLAAGYNLGFSKTNSKYVLFLGSDVYPKKKDVCEIYNYMNQNPKVGISTAKLVTRDGNIDWDAHRGFPTPWAALTYFAGLPKVFPKSKLFNQYFLGHKSFSDDHEIDLCISHFMMVRSEAHKKVGKWDEEFFLFGEDVDFCYRMKQEGYKIMYLPHIEVLHYKGAGMGRKTSKDLKTFSSGLKKTKQIMSTGRTRAMKMFYDKHYKKKYPWVLTSIVLLGIFLLEKLRQAASLLRSS